MPCSFVTAGQNNTNRHTSRAVLLLNAFRKYGENPGRREKSSDGGTVGAGRTRENPRGAGVRHGTGISVREQGLGDLGKKANDTNQTDGAPEIGLGGTDLIGGPDDVDRAEEVAPFGMACQNCHILSFNIISISISLAKIEKRVGIMGYIKSRVVFS
jgi:hypothetical protein